MIRSTVACVAFALTLVGHGVASAQTGDQVTYYHTDAVGSVRMITDQNGQVVARYDYLPFGEPWNPPTNPDPRRFAGKERDQETGFDYFGARYYASGNGRFTTVDPDQSTAANLTDPQLWNRYAYVRNNPLRYTDPDGRCIWDFCVAEIAAVAGVSEAAVLAAQAATAASVFVWHNRTRIAESVVETGQALGAAVVWASAKVTIGLDRTAQDRLRRDTNGVSIPDPEAAGREHTQLGTRVSKKTGEAYPQAREFDAQGNEVLRRDFTDHGRKDHTDPHLHRRDLKTGKIRPHEPFEKDPLDK